MKRLNVILAAAVALLIVAVIVLVVSPSACGKSRKRVVIGRGFCRGFAMVTLKNKHAGYVSNVYHFTGDMVKKGDVILEYDDYDWRVKHSAAADAVEQQKLAVISAQIALDMKNIDPLPSEYRNLKSKKMAAAAKMKRIEHEMDVYKKLHNNNIVSDLAYREKINDLKDAESDVESFANDTSILERGLGKLYVDAARNNLEIEKKKLVNLEHELALIEEDHKFYKIVAPWDGMVETNSDTVHAWNDAATAAAEMHDFSSGTKVYFYMDERDVGYVTIGEEYRWRTNLFDCDKIGFPIIRPFKVKKTHSSFGDRSLYLVETVLVSSPKPLDLNSTGQVEIEVED
ncbi:MAG: hypothetical protein MJ025_00140 [Victivallaceae bacterium]|nr:hypothetical protein [Victivallaceae bacterium]